jgi:DNA-damage-inducible protein D
LQKLLVYTLWQNFEKVLAKSKNACINVVENVNNHFIDVNKMVEMGSSAEKEIHDILLTRYACYLIAQNGDNRKNYNAV